MAAYKDTLHRIMRSDFDDVSNADKASTIEEIKTVCSVAAAAAAFQPVPVVDVLIISPIQIAMVQAIGRVHGHKLDTRSVIEMLSTFGTSILARNVICTVVKLVPFGGWALAASVSYSLTYATGEVADCYFRSGRGASASELKAKFKEVYEKTKSAKQADYKTQGKLKDRLEQLREAHEAGHLDAEQYEAMKQKILTDF